VERAARSTEDLLAIPLRPRVLTLLQRLAADPDPTPDADTARADEPFSKALNGIRSRAIEAVIAFAQTSHPDAPFIDRPAMVHMPEIRQLLDDHLDVGKDPSPSVRAIYGARLGHLFFLDEGWTGDRLGVIFDPARPDLATAAWHGYLLDGFLAPRVVEHVVTAGLYNDRVDALADAPEPNPEAREVREVRNRLVDHVGLVWCRGITGSEALLDRFYARAPGEDRAYLVRWIGLSVLHEDDAADLAAEVAGRLPDLWNTRLQQLAGNKDDAEVTAYGWWYSSGKLPEPQGTALLTRTLDATQGHVDDLRGCLERVTQAATENPSGACEVLAAIVAADGRDELRYADNHVANLVEAVAATGAERADADVLAEVERLVNELGEHGLGDYRPSLLAGRSRGESAAR
jgi:hypothetical protein